MYRQKETPPPPLPVPPPPPLPGTIESASSDEEDEIGNGEEEELAAAADWILLLADLLIGNLSKHRFSLGHQPLNVVFDFEFVLGLLPTKRPIFLIVAQIFLVKKKIQESRK